MQIRKQTDDFPEHAYGKEAVPEAADCLSEQLNFGCIRKWSLVNHMSRHEEKLVPSETPRVRISAIGLVF